MRSSDKKMKILNGLGGFVSATLLILMATSMISATVAEINLDGVPKKNTTLSVHMAEDSGAASTRRNSLESCESLRPATPAPTDAAVKVQRCPDDAYQASLLTARQPKHARAYRQKM